MRLRRVVVLTVPALACGFLAYVAWLGRGGGPPSRCLGTNAAGSLQGGRRLPYAGENFEAYSLLGYLMGRTFMHGLVRDAIQESYAELARQHPELRFVYAEASWPWGGRLLPHRTHRNGTAVDFHVPVRSSDGAVTTIPTSILHLFGYGVDFDRAGRSGARVIDFRAMGLHLLALERAARARGIPIRRVIFDIELQPRLRASGAEALRQLAFNQAQAWVRHDEHYHVEFGVPCQ